MFSSRRPGCGQPRWRRARHRPRLRRQRARLAEAVPRRGMQECFSPTRTSILFGRPLGQTSTAQKFLEHGSARDPDFRHPTCKVNAPNDLYVAEAVLHQCRQAGHRDHMRLEHPGPLEVRVELGPALRATFISARNKKAGRIYLQGKPPQLSNKSRTASCEPAEQKL